MGIYEFKKDDAYSFAQFLGTKTSVSGDELIFEKCPFCGGRSEKRSNQNKFAINLKTGQYNCFRASCRAHGNMITLSRAFNFELPGYADEYYNTRKKYISFRGAVRPTVSDRAVEYLRSRGISEKVTKKYEITTDKTNPDLLMIPFYDEENELQLVKYRNLKATKENGLAKEFVLKDHKSDLSCKPILFGMNHCESERNKVLVMTEGQIDSLSLVEAGIENAVSVPLGCNGFTWVPYCWDFLCRYNILIVFGDYEHGRITLLEDMQKYFGGEVRSVRPEDYRGCKDANEILQKYGVLQLQACVQNAEAVHNKNFVRLSEVRQTPVSQMDKIETGIETLNTTLGGFYFGQLIVLTGERGDGKSTLSNQWALFAVKSGVKTFIYSGELPNGSLRDWIDHQAAGDQNILVHKNEHGGNEYDLKPGISEKVAKWYSDYLWIYKNTFSDDTEEKPVSEIILDATKQGFRFIIVDNLMTALDDDTRVDLYRAQTILVKQLVRIAKAKDVIIVLVAHQRKNQGTVRNADDVAGSANITNLADVVISFGRPKEKEASYDREIKIQKNRLTGRIGKTIPLWYQESSRRISDVDEYFGWPFGWEDRQDGFLNVDDDFINPFEVMI